MRLKHRLALVVVLLLSSVLGGYSLLLWPLPRRAEAEAAGALPWVVRLLPDHVDPRRHGFAAQRQALAALVQGLDGTRPVRVLLRSPDGAVLARTPDAARSAPSWLGARLAGPVTVTRKDVLDGDQLVAYFEVTPAGSDALAALWVDFMHNATLLLGLWLAAVLPVLWFMLRSLQPLDRICAALRARTSDRQDARLPAFANPQMDEIARSFNRMADAQAASGVERQALVHQLIDSEENTRRSVAHDLHDELSPYLVALQPLVRTLQLRCAERPDLADLAALAETLVGHQSQVLARLRTILAGLHPPELQTLGLRGAIECLAIQPLPGDDGRRIEVRFDAGGDWLTFGPTLDLSVYRLLQECLNNARRHAAGSRVDIRFDTAARIQGRAMLAIEVANDALPQRSAAGAGGLGLPGMRERCRVLGGCFDAGLRQGNRWCVRMFLPLDAPVHRSRDAAHMTHMTHNRA